MWALCTVQEVLAPEEVAERMRTFAGTTKGPQ
jgi:hypothetical protein